MHFNLQRTTGRNQKLQWPTKWDWTDPRRMQQDDIAEVHDLMEGKTEERGICEDAWHQHPRHRQDAWENTNAIRIWERFDDAYDYHLMNDEVDEAYKIWSRAVEAYLDWKYGEPPGRATDPTARGHTMVRRPWRDDRDYHQKDSNYGRWRRRLYNLQRRINATWTKIETRPDLTTATIKGVRKNLKQIRRQIQMRPQYEAHPIHVDKQNNDETGTETIKILEEEQIDTPDMTPEELENNLRILDKRITKQLVEIADNYKRHKLKLYKQWVDESWNVSKKGIFRHIRGKKWPQ